MSFNRTHHCNELRPIDIAARVTLCGWVNASRNLGGLIFLDLRDREGITQICLDPISQPALAAVGKDIREEWVISVTGTVRARPEKMINLKRQTGAIEVLAERLEVLNRAEPMPFHLEDQNASEDLRLKYRYLEMRRSNIGPNLRLRHRIGKIIRDILDANGFIEVETPILSKSTPEGARDYLVPSRIRPGSFYALPQAPQQYKQLLMVGGLEKYFQIARCFRDEDLRADRQPEFTQIDLEMSFVDQDEVMALVEQLVAAVVKDVHQQELPLPLPRLTWKEALDKYGSDKPDLRFGLELQDLEAIFAETTFRAFAAAKEAGGTIKGFNAKGMADYCSRKILDELTETGKLFGAQGLVWLKVDSEGELTGSAAKFLTSREKESLSRTMLAAPGDLLLIIADSWLVACNALGRLRLEIAERAGLTAGKEFKFLWVTEFPLLDWDPDEKRFVAVHHPFTSPLDEDIAKLSSEPGQTRAKAYDIVLNGVELGGGSIRIHNSALQSLMFKTLGISDEEAQLRFGHLLEAFTYGAPPHGGLALGFDRFVMLMAGAKSIREVIAFPKTTKASCLLTDSPSLVDPQQLSELGIACTKQSGRAFQSQENPS